MTATRSSVSDFTGLALNDCFNATREDWVRARAVINSTDHAEAIADMGWAFYAVLKGAAATDQVAA